MYRDSGRPELSRLLIVTTLSCLSLLTLAGCVQIRQLTYPNTFTWIGEEDVKTTMQSMATGMGKLNRLVVEETQLGSNLRDILIELDNIEFAAASLSIRTPAGDPDLPATNHLLIDDHMDDFLESILRARLQAESTPPNYYGVGQLTGSCSGCHRLR